MADPTTDVHDLPLVFSENDPQHDLTRDCWCDPTFTTVEDGTKVIHHTDTQRGDS